MKTVRIDLRMEPNWIEKLDAWRRKQPDIPTRTEAVRRIVNIMLQHMEKETTPWRTSP